MKRIGGSRLGVILGAILAAALGGCDHNNGNDGTPVGTAPSSTVTRTMLAHGDFDLPPSQGRGYNLVSATMVVPFTSNVSGDLSAQVDWTPASDAIAIAFYPDGCASGQLGAGACSPLAASQLSGAVSEVTVHLVSARSGQYVLGIQNRGGNPESGAYQVVIEH